MRISLSVVIKIRWISILSFADNVIKNPYLDSDAPFEWIHLSVRGIDI